MMLGAVIDPVTHQFSYPGWCDWMPFADYFDSCQPATSAQIAAAAVADLSGSANTPENQAAITASVTQSIAADCAAGDQNCLAYQMSQNCPSMAATIGTGTVAQGLCSLSNNLPSGSFPFVLIGIAALGIYAFTRH